HAAASPADAHCGAPRDSPLPTLAVGLRDRLCGVQRVADLQRLAEPAVQLSALDRAWRLAGGSVGVALQRHVVARPGWNRLSRLRVYLRAFPTRFGAPHAACRGPGFLVCADVSAWAPDRSLQCGSASVVPRCDRRTSTASRHWPRDLEAGAAWRTGESFGGYPIARNIHLTTMFLIVAFIVVHVVLVAIFPRTLVSMIVGTPAEPKN